MVTAHQNINGAPKMQKNYGIIKLSFFQYCEQCWGAGSF